LLTEAGFPSGIKTTYTVNSAVSNRDVVTAIASYLGKAGITVDMKMVDGTTANSQYAEGWTGLQGSASSIGANVNASLTALTKDNPVWFVSMEKTEAFYELYRASITSPDYDPALVQKCVKYYFDNATFNSIYANPRGAVLPPWVHDTGFYTRHRFWYWDPADCWMSKH
jgi:ABC-type transport system substrate-binding protein